MDAIIRNQLQHEHQLVAVLDPEFNFIAVNEAYARADERSADFYPGKNHFELYPCEENRALFQQVIDSGRPHYEEARAFEYRHAPERGTSYWDWSLLPIKDEAGAVTGLLLTLINATRRVEGMNKQATLQRQLLQSQKLEAIGQLAGGVAHDFNNLLAVIMGNAELARLNLDRDHPVHADLKEIVLAAEQARDLTQRMLAFARRQAPVKSLFRASLIIEDLAAILQRSLSKKIKLTLQQHGDCLLEVDRNQVLQALINISHNAAEAMPDGGQITVSLDTVRVDGRTCPSCQEKLSGEMCRILIEDKGQGMDEQVRDRAFEPFYTTKTHGAGTGLGLSATHGIVLEHGGHLHIESKVGQGTRVEILLPIPAESARALEEAEQSAAPAGMRVLLVDDEPQVRRLAARMLELAGHQVSQAASADEAEDLFAAEPRAFDLVILDMMMPDKDGLQLLESLKKLRPDLRAVLASGYALEQQDGNLQAAGIGSVLQKPYSYDRLMAAIDEAMA